MGIMIPFNVATRCQNLLRMEESMPQVIDTNEILHDKIVEDFSLKGELVESVVSSIRFFMAQEFTIALPLIDKYLADGLLCPLHLKPHRSVECNAESSRRSIAILAEACQNMKVPNLSLVSA